MASLISNTEKADVAQIFDDIFDTWSRPIVIYKEPIKQQIAPQDPGAIFGFAAPQGTELFTYTPVTGVYQALIKYQNSRGQNSDLFQSELNTYISDAPVSIKVKADCKDFIINGKTEYVMVDDLSYILKVAMPNPQKMWDSSYFIFELERKM